jgi:predicted nucleotidyltransferase
MRLHDIFSDVFSRPTRVQVVRTLIRSAGGGGTGRELARAAGCSAPQAIEALQQFEALGLVTRQVVGRAHNWKLVEDHVLVDPLRALFSFESKLPERFRDDLRKEFSRLPIQGATLFGSIARGSETNASDADLYLRIGRSSDEEKVQKALTPITMRFIRKYGTAISALIHSDEDAKKPANPGLMVKIREEGIPVVPERE